MKSQVCIYLPGYICNRRADKDTIINGVNQQNQWILEFLFMVSIMIRNIGLIPDRLTAETKQAS